jgi:hypothetical protein
MVRIKRFFIFFKLLIFILKSISCESFGKEDSEASRFVARVLM